MTSPPHRKERTPLYIVPDDDPRTARRQAKEAQALERLAALTGNPTGKLMLSVEDAAHLMHVSTKHIRRMLARKELPFIYIGHVIRLPYDALLDWIDCQTLNKAEGVDKARTSSAPKKESA